MKEIMTMAEAAEYLRLNYCTLSRKVKAGKIPAFRIGSKILFRLSALEKWIAAQERKEAIADVLEQSSVLIRRVKA